MIGYLLFRYLLNLAAGVVVAAAVVSWAEAAGEEAAVDLNKGSDAGSRTRCSL
jgi:hypothetical protein